MHNSRDRSMVTESTSGRSKVRIGGQCEPFWRHFNTAEWEPEWRALVGVLEHEHVSVDWRLAIERLRHDVHEKSANLRLSAYKDWLGHLEVMLHHERSEQLRDVLQELLEHGKWDVMDALFVNATTQRDVGESCLCLRVLRGLCLFIPKMREKFVGEKMESLLARLLDETEDQKNKVEILELLLVVVADDQNSQRDFMRRNGVSTVCAMYTSDASSSELLEGAKTFISVFIEYILPGGKKAALSSALTAEARETVAELIGAHTKDVYVVKL